MDLLNTLSDIGVVPVVRIEDASCAPKLMDALTRGGLPCAEITFRTDAAADAIRRIRAACPEALVGAGTVLTSEQADRAADAGARFIVSPGLNPRVVERCRTLGVPVIPGCATPSDVERALELGLTTVKFFPAEQSGGPGFLKAISAPYRNVRFMPTGGLNLQNLPRYLELGCVLCCGGSWMVKPEWLAEGDFAAVESAARDTVRALLELRLAHIGLNAADPQEAARTARMFSLLLGAPPADGPTSYFITSAVEVNKTPGRGRMGHIAFTTRSVERAEYQLGRLGFHPEESSRGLDAAGHTRILYLQEDFGGFAVHLLRGQD